MVRVHLGSSGKKKLLYKLDSLTRHAAVIGTTGSGKTVMCKILIEEALQQGIPVIAIDPKGDIGSLGITDKNFDFRPFGDLNNVSASKKASEYVDNLKETNVKYRQSIDRLRRVKTQIYTLKCSAGKHVALMPKLEAPKKFKELTEVDPLLIANFVEPVSENIIQLADITGALKEKAQSLVSSILIHNWEKNTDLTIEELIKQVITPPLELVGSLPLEDFIKEKDRKKLAASINLLLTSPSKKAWAHGEKLDVSEMLKRNTLTVFDLRFSGTTEDKQFIVDRLMQEIYKFLLQRGGSDKLKFILYFDELAGFLPPAPANPPSKKLLELLIRQARAFGLGIILATQNPGDIDYKLLGNVGTRFIGKLRTENDIKKVSTAMDLVNAEVRETLKNVQTGEFIYNNAIENKTEKMKARWIVSYHAGPLKLNEIRWINNPTLKPQREGKIEIITKREAEKKEKKKIRNEKSSNDYSNSKDILTDIVEKVKKEADITKIKMAVTNENKFAPHLKIVIEPQKEKGLTFEMQGPYVFDLTTKIIPLENYLRKVHWSQTIKKDIHLLKPHRSIKQTVEYAVRGAQNNLKVVYYESSIINMKRKEKSKIEQMNYEHLMQSVKGRLGRIQKKYLNKNKPLNEKIKNNNSKITDLRKKNLKQKTTRIVKKVLTKKNIMTKTKEMHDWEKKIKQYKRENDSLKKKVDKNNEISKNTIERINEQTKRKASSLIKQYIYKPTRDKLIIHATIMLVPVKRI